MNLSDDEIHVWLAFGGEVRDGGVLAEYEAMLQPDERERLARLRFGPQRHQFLVTRALQRTVLAAYLPGLAPHELRFITGVRGKPALAGDSSAMNLHFNVAHTQGLVAIALCREAMVGIDVENITKRTAPLEIAKRYFTAEEAHALADLPREQQLARFFSLWTLKESWLKATGLGLAAGLGNISFALGSGHGVTRVNFANDDARHWTFWQACPTAEHVLALAVRHAVRPVPGAQAMHVKMWRCVPGTPPVGEPLAPPSVSGQEKRAQP
ncbi:MAG: 4'-phosphopantetheinyl transferase superfamily protein [Pseudomonadota bacterium]